MSNRLLRAVLRADSANYEQVVVFDLQAQTIHYLLFTIRHKILIRDKKMLLF